MFFSGKYLDRKYDGKLIVVEGLDGSGKSTQMYLLKRWLESNHYKVFLTEWNSSEFVRQAIKRGKKKKLLTSTTFSLIHATDFADRFERQIYPLLRSGFITLADRYIFTAFARDSVRGCSDRWLRNLYSFAPIPDLIFYFRVPVSVAIERLMLSRTKIKYYEAGMDLNLHPDILESFKIFQSKIAEKYEQMVKEFNFVVIDATLPIEEQQKIIRETIEAKIDLCRFKMKGQGG